MFYIFYRIFNITTSIPLNCGVEKQKDHQPQNEEKTGYYRVTKKVFLIDQHAQQKRKFQLKYEFFLY